MKKLIYLILLSILLLSSVFAGEKIIYQKVRIPVQNDMDLRMLQKIGLDFESAYFEKGKFIELIIAEYEIEKIENAGFTYEVQIEDMSNFYASRLYNREGKGFGYGSMGGFYTFEEVNAQLDSMYAQFPNLITQKTSIGTSTLGRPLYMVQISNNPGTNDGDPEMLYTGLHHAREPQGMMAVLYYMWHLLENYGSDAEVTYIVDNRQLWFVPVVNPDGYVHNQETNPSGGGMLRKNGRDNDSDGDNFDYNDGVDPNRNYEYEWGDQWGGSSSDPSDQTYRGPEPFSEPELQAIRDFCNVHQFRAALNYHTYSNLLLYPWGYDNVACEDDGIFASLAAEMTVVNNYTTGRPGNAIGYNANGSSDDWMYGEQVTKSKIFAFTPEVGSYSDGFWPSTDR
ncbi:MAG: zinc carboxypeptidase, partial [Calditrichia bacterium]|nr:zinc carboxypeptidase [Calditrichia bacterium]